MQQDAYHWGEMPMTPGAEDYLVQGTQFWVVKPSISLAGITGLEALVKGNYIAIRPGDKGSTPEREFVARPKAPPLDLRSPGLHMVLFTDNLGSLDVGSPILYKQVKVGSVQSYQFSRTKKQLVIGVHIEKEYDNLYAYAVKRLDRCVFGAEKPACKQCPVHCYQPAKREDQVITGEPGKIGRASCRERV